MIGKLFYHQYEFARYPSKIFACTSPFYPRHNVWENIFDESNSFESHILEGDEEMIRTVLNSPEWYRMVAVAHPFVRLYNTWNIMSGLEKKTKFR